MKAHTTTMAFLAWFIVGVTLAGTVQVLRATATGGADALVFAGRLEPAHVIVADHLPAAPVATDHGHDGQIFFAIGTDPTAATTPDSLVPAYRYRRILYPAVAGLFGTLDGQYLLWGMIILTSLGAGLAAGAVGGAVTDLGVSWLAPLAVALNPGIWLSAMFLTADTLALAFGLLGVWAFLREKDSWAIVALTAAALTKETHIVFAIGLAGYLWFEGRHARAARYLLLPAIPLSIWLSFVAMRVGNPFSSGGNIVRPFQGVLESLSVWTTATGVELFFTVSTLLGAVLAAITLAFRGRLLGWLVGPWLCLALVSSHLVWDLGNNSIRTLAPLFTLGILGLLIGRKAPQHASTGTVSRSG